MRLQSQAKAALANNVLLARKLVEKVFVLYNCSIGVGTATVPTASLAIDLGFINKCRQVDKCITALILDLKQRGLLEETLIVWAENLAARLCGKTAREKDALQRP